MKSGEVNEKPVNFLCDNKVKKWLELPVVGAAGGVLVI